MNPFFPRIDWRGDGPGFVACEFPVYSYLVAIVYHLGIVDESIGRIINIVLYCLITYWVYHLAQYLHTRYVGLAAAFFVTISPLCVAYSRSFQPDTMMLAASLMGVWYFCLWAERGGRWRLVLSVAAMALAGLIKPFSLFLGLPMLYISWRRYGRAFLQVPALWVTAIGILSPVALWYAHAHNLWQEYGNTFGIFEGYNKLGIPDGPLLLETAETLARRARTSITTPAGFVLAIIGCFAKARQLGKLLHVWACGFAVCVFFTARGQIGHDYYQLPMVIIMAIWAGAGMETVWRGATERARMALVSLLFLAAWTLSVPRVLELTYISAENVEVSFAERVGELTGALELGVFVRDSASGLIYHRASWGETFNASPKQFYYSRRKGWCMERDRATPESLEIVRLHGARFVATLAPYILDRRPTLRRFLQENCIALDVNDKWAIYRFRETID